MPVALIALATAFANAQTLTTKMYGSTNAPGGGRFSASDKLTVKETGPQVLQQGRIIQGTNSNAWSNVEISAKSMKATSYVHLADQTEGDSWPYSASTNTESTLSDRITMHSDEHWGQDGTMKVRMRVKGNTSAACWNNSPLYGWDSAESEYFFSFEAKSNIHPATNFYRHRYSTYSINNYGGENTHSHYNGGFTNPVDLDDQDIVELIIPFSFNSGFDLNIRLLTSADVEGTVGYAGADFGGGSFGMGLRGFDADATSFEWMGITEVRDSSGNLVNEYTATGLGGVDYRTGAQPVPEPASMIALGAGALGLLKRRNRKV